MLAAMNATNPVLDKAFAWLMAHRGEAARAAIDTMLYDGVGEAERRALENLDAETTRRIQANAAEWLLAEGPVGIDAAPFADAERAWLAQLAQRPLCLYEVVGASPQGALTLRDALDADAEPIAVAAAGADLAPGTLVGARVLEVAGRLELSGALYPFSPGAGEAAVARLHEAAALFGDGGADLPAILGVVLRHCWFAQYDSAKAYVRDLKAASPEACGSKRVACAGTRAKGKKGRDTVNDEIEAAIAAALAPKD